MGNTLLLYTIYDSPKDYPGKFVITKWKVAYGVTIADPDYKFVVDDLATCREEMRRLGLYRLGREPGDDPVIVETWV